MAMTVLLIYKVLLPQSCKNQWNRLTCGLAKKVCKSRETHVLTHICCVLFLHTVNNQPCIIRS